MSEIEKVSIFNPKDKLSEREKPKIYLDCVPQKLKSIVKQNKCKYDLECHKWFTLDEKSKMIHDFSKKRIDFWDYMNEMGIQYDKENKSWYTYNSNEALQKFFIS
jgi:hypothetical protein